MEGCSELWPWTGRCVANTHTLHHTHSYITTYSSIAPLYCLIQCFSGFLFPYQIIFRVTSAETNVCVAVVFYMHEVEQWYVRHKYFIVLYHRLHVSTYIQVIFRPSFTGKSLKCYTCRDPIMLKEVKYIKT